MRKPYGKWVKADIISEAATIIEETGMEKPFSIELFEKLSAKRLKNFLAPAEWDNPTCKDYVLDRSKIEKLSNTDILAMLSQDRIERERKKAQKEPHLMIYRKGCR